MLEIKHLRSGYGYVQALWDISVSVSAGEFVALLGPNGAGKTTTLRTIAGFMEPWSGEIQFMARSTAGLPPHELMRLGLSFVPEDQKLFTGMTVYENLQLGAYCVRDRQQIIDSLEGVFTLFPVLAERRAQIAGTLSGGERKMLAIGRGLMGSPKLLLVDEPSIGLAPMLVLDVLHALKKLSAMGCTVLLVEQNVNTTLQLVDRAYIIEQGRVILEGPAQTLRADDHVRSVYLGG